MPSVYFRITLLEPAIFDALEGEPNSAVSYPYIPGSVIRGMLIGAYLRKYGLRQLDAADPDIKRLFFNGETRCLNATIIERETGWRTLPAPLSLQRPKEDKTQVYDSLMRHDEGDEGAGSMKALREAFIILHDNALTIQQISRTLNIHTQRPRGTQADPDARRRALLFRYDALTRGQTFSGVVRCQNEVDANEIVSLLPEGHVVTIGGARSAGYGRVLLHNVVLDDDFLDTMITDHGDRLIVTLVSDTILRDAYGQPSPTVDGLLNALSPFGVTVSAWEQMGAAALDTSMTGGFNRKWGLPLVQMPALRAGSVLAIRPDSMPDRAQLEGLMWWGIGERRAEGYGQVVVNWQVAASYSAVEAEPLLRDPMQVAPVAVPATLDPARIDRLKVRIEGYVQQRRVGSKMARDIYSDQNLKIHNAPSRTQIGRLRRLIAGQLRRPIPDANVLETFLKDIKGKHAAKQFDDARIAGKSMRRWLEQMVTEAKNERQGNPDGGARITLRYVDTVLERIQKESKHDDRNR